MDAGATTVPIATYRVQMHAEFDFFAAAELADYLSQLGVSHFYLSPYLQAAPGSKHGYDVVDYSRPNSELGGMDGHRHFSDVARGHGMGVVLDIVPNHMSIVGRQNHWWWDVLENGRSSRYASFFDVEWDAPEEKLKGKLLLPTLGARFGQVLQAGQLQVVREGGAFVLRYQEHAWPISPGSISDLLRDAAELCNSDELAFVADACSQLPSAERTHRDSVQRRHRNKEIIRQLLERLCEQAAVAEAIDRALATLNADTDRLDELLSRQSYRVAYWRSAAEDLGYRRFFDINSLVAINSSQPHVFRPVHEQILQWVKQGDIDGLRVDHVDGLADPQGYLEMLHEATPHCWIVIEKILEPTEELPCAWQVAGTTGYDFLRVVGGLFVDPDGREPLRQFYREFTSESRAYAEVVYDSKQDVLRDVLGSDVNRLADRLVDICERDRMYRDYSRRELSEALREVLACFPVYRTYVRSSAPPRSEQDEHYVQEAIEEAKRRRPDLDGDLFHFLRELLLLRVAGQEEAEFVRRFQQLSGPAMAKGAEDTAFYRYFPLASLNEVGGNPDDFGMDVTAFHDACVASQKHWPLRMLTTSTHDTKRSEDVRARLHVLSEMPELWRHSILEWAEHNARYWDSMPPDRNMEYLFYQTSVGAWPIDADRMWKYMQKAACEAKTETSWTRHNSEYERGLKRFVRSALGDTRYCDRVGALVGRLLLPARISSLAQTLIKFTAPGIPDMFQGTELWDLSLVDPDNRRPVDYGLRRQFIRELDELTVQKIVERMDEGLPKLWTIQKALQVRRQIPQAFGPEGAYEPVDAHGEHAKHVVAFRRGHDIMTVVPRLVYKLGPDWSDTSIELGNSTWQNAFTGDRVTGTFPISRLLSKFPIALLLRQNK